MTLSKYERKLLRRELGIEPLNTVVSGQRGPEYMMAFGCLKCKTSHKRKFDGDPCDYPATMMCPICKETSYNFGRKFKPPKKSNTLQWKKIEYLVSHGFYFQPVQKEVEKNIFYRVKYPETLNDAKDFVIEYKNQTLKINMEQNRFEL